MKSLFILLICSFFAACNAQVPKMQSAADNNTLLWEISGKNIKQAYLLGTFHLMCRKDIHISKNTLTAIKSADEVYFEMDLDDPSTTFGALLYMNMKGYSLKDLYTPDEYNRVEIFFRDSLKTPFSMLQKMKPLFLQSLLYPKMMPCNEYSGVEEELMKVAKEDKKEINGFETIQFQASIFDSIPYKEQAKMLLNTIDSMPAFQAEFDSMLDLYKSQRISDLDSGFIKGEIGSLENKELLLDNRNKNWVKQLHNLLPAKSLFIAVGAGHLVGKAGLIELLRKEGYTVRPLLNN